MKALFVDLSCNFYDKHWVYALAPVLKRRGVEVGYVNIRSVKGVAKVKAFAPDLVLYSAFSNELPKTLAFDRALKGVWPCKSLMGGAGATFDWACHKGATIDAVCIGDGETGLADYLDSGFTGGRNIIPNGQDRPAALADLTPMDELPFPDRDAVYQVDPVLAAMTSKQFMSGRGCPYECAYCFNHAYNRMFKGCGPLVRKKSVEYMLDEIQQVQRKYPLKLVAFQDDTFIVDQKWLLEFRDKFPSRIGLPFSCNIRANLVNDTVAAALRDAGCVFASWSIESGNARIRNEVLHRHMSDEAILNAGALLNKYGIRQRLANVIGIPGETLEDLHDTVRMNIAVHPVMATANIFVPFPGLRLTEYALEHGHLSPDKARNLPKDFWHPSVLNISKAHGSHLRKTFCLFPFFTRFPTTFENPHIRRLLYALPFVLLRTVYEAVFLVNCMRMFRIGGSWRVKLLMLGRYIRNILEG